MNLAGKDNMPSKDSERTMSSFSFFIVWIGIAVQLVIFISAAQLYPALSPVQILLACLVGNLIVAVLVVLTGDIGVRYGLTYPVYLRSCFGYAGTHIASFIRAIPAIFWFGFQTWVGAYALNSIMMILIGYSNIILLTIAFGIVQIINTAKGINAIQKLEWIASPAIIIVGIIIQIILMKRYHLSFGDLLTLKGVGGVSFFYAIAVTMGNYITFTLNVCDFTRFLKVGDKDNWFKANKGSMWAQTTGLLISLLMFTLIGITSGVATGNWNPIEVLVSTIGEDNPLVLFPLLIFVIFAQWSSNITANLLPPGNVIVNFYPKKINFAMAATIAGVVGLLIQPWLLADHTDYILTIITSLLSPIVGIMVCDYYLLRKRKLNINELYKNNGQYKYWKNINPAAVLAYAPAVLAALVYNDYGFFIAFIISTVIYYILMKSWIGKIYYQPEIFEDNMELNNYLKVED